MTSHPKMANSLALLCAASGALLLLSESSCQKHGVCDDVAGSCLALHVEGDGPFDTLRTTLSLNGGSDEKRIGDTPGDDGNVELPVTLRVLPPPSVTASQITQVAVAGMLSSVETARATSDSSFIWPDDTHIELTLRLNAVDDLPDGGTNDDGGGDNDMRTPGDMAMPPTELKWRVEPTTPKVNLYSVWAGGSAQVYAVGESGTILARQGDGSWKTDPAGTTVALNGVTGLAGSSAWTVGDVPGAWRRDSMKWNVDNSGLNLASSTLYTVSVGATGGELWAGDRDGRVWHRTGSATASGTWGAAEQVFPAGTAVYGVSSSGGAVYAVGANGRVAVRKDSAPGTTWTPFQYPAAPMGGVPTWNGVWAFDKNNAVAVGTGGVIGRYSGGSWQTSTQINTQALVLFAVWGLSDSRFWAVGEDGLIIRVEGAKATELQRNTMQRLYGIHGLNEKDIYIVGAGMGNSSLILHGTP